MKQFKMIAAVAALALVASSAFAVEPAPAQSSSYVKLYGGLTLPLGSDSSTYERSGVGGTTGGGVAITEYKAGSSGSFEFKKKYAFGASFGMNFTDMVSAEVEYNYSRLGFEKFMLANGSTTTGTPPATTTAANTQDNYDDNVYFAAHTFFANVMLHLKPARQTLSPYVGLGVGYMPSAKLELEKTSALMAKTYELDSGKIMGQAIAGLAYNINTTTQISLEARYARPLDGDKLSLKNTKETVDTISSFKYEPVSVLVGVNYSF